MPDFKTKKPQIKKVFIVDDHPIMRHGLAQLIATEPNLQVCGEAADAFQAMEIIGTAKPDLVLADISLPGKSGIELIKEIHSAHPGIAILVLSMHDESLYAERVLRAGGRGYIMKQEGSQKLTEAIRQVLDGHIYVSEKISCRILEIFSGRRTKTSVPSVENLTDREFEVFQLIGKGVGTKEIAQQLGLSAKTVEVHRLNIKAKLGLKTAAELIRYAVRWVEAHFTESPEG